MRSNIYTTRAVLDEAQHKLDILETEDDLLESYGITEADVEAIRQSLSRKGAAPIIFQFMLTSKQREALAGELGNSADIQDSNIGHIRRSGGDKKEASTLARFACDLRRAIKQLESEK